MNYQFLYDFPGARNVSILGDFNGWQKVNHMKRDKTGLWLTEIDLAPGEYYYKYLIDNLIKMNDPMANMYLPRANEEDYLASRIVINQKGEILINQRRYKVHLENYNLSDKVTGEIFNKKKTEFTSLDKEVVAFFRFNPVEGLHPITLIWYRPDGQYYHYDETALWQDSTEPVDIWFFLELHNTLPEGKWNLNFYIDGMFIFQDSFKFKQVTYGSHEEDEQIAHSLDLQA